MPSLRELLNGGAAAAPAAAPTPAPAAAKPAAAPAPMQSTGDPTKDLELLLAGFEANQGVAPKVNPPEAAKVLATATAQEVAGVPEPEEPDTGPVVEPPTSKPAAVVAAEAAPKNRRTAAVVQQELDQLLQLHNKLSSEHEGLKAELAGYADKVRAEFTAEIETLEADKAKAFLRVDELQQLAESQKDMVIKAGQVIKQLQAGVPAATASNEAYLNVDQLAERYPALLLAGALAKQGWEPYLGVPKS